MNLVGKFTDWNERFEPLLPVKKYTHVSSADGASPRRAIPDRTRLESGNQPAVDQCGDHGALEQHGDGTLKTRMLQARTPVITSRESDQTD
jgi:hypothetical protein